MTGAFGIDIGGSTIKAAEVDASGTLRSPVIQEPTPRPATPRNVLEVLQSLIDRTGAGGPVGVGFPGVVKDDRALSAPHLDSAWRDQSLVELFSGLSATHVAALNDADAALLAEMRLGAGQGFGNGVVLLCTLGTGIGTALWHDGCLIPNMELGHVELNGADAELIAAASVRVAENLDWSEYGRRVQRYLSHLEMLLSFDLCILGGGVIENLDRFADCLTLRSELLPARLGNSAGLVGAALYAMDS